LKASVSKGSPENKTGCRNEFRQPILQ
jgi:hypothetical protein